MTIFFWTLETQINQTIKYDNIGVRRFGYFPKSEMPNYY